MNRSRRDLDANHSRNPRERVNIRGMEVYSGRREDILVDVGRRELLAPSKVAGVITVFVMSACDGGGHRRFVLINVRLCKRIRKDTTGSCRKPTQSGAGLLVTMVRNQ